MFEKNLCDVVLEDLLAGERVTPRIALRRHNCMSLAARIHQLRTEGWPIESERATTKSGKNYSVYWMTQAGVDEFCRNRPLCGGNYAKNKQKN